MIHASHIEQPKRKFTVTFDRSGYFNEYWHPGETRTVTVLAETGEGALKIAAYHWPMGGSNFRLES